MTISFLTLALAPMNLKATTADDDNDGPALTMTRETHKGNPSGDDIKEIESDKHSENAAVVQEKNTEHNVKGASAAGQLAHKGERTFTNEDGDVFKTITPESADQSQASESKINQGGI